MVISQKLALRLLNERKVLAGAVTQKNPLHHSPGGGGYSHILAIRVCDAGECMVFKLFGLVKGMVFKPFGLVKDMVFKPFGLVEGIVFKPFGLV